MKAKKKPVIVDYYPINGNYASMIHDIELWVKSFGDDITEKFNWATDDDIMIFLSVKTLEGTSYHVSDNDVIIRGVKGEYYPCKKDIFYETYEIIEKL